MPLSNSTTSYSRGEFLRLCARGAGGFALLSGLPPAKSALRAQAITPKESKADSGYRLDLREFIGWIQSDFEPSVRLSGGAGRYMSRPGETAPALYGVADMACVLYTIGALHPTAKERAEWADAFELFQVPETGWFLEKSSGLSPEHNTAFALAAMQLLDLEPKYPVKMDAKYQDIRAYLNTLDWRTGVYKESHKGAGIGAIFTLVPALRSTEWFAKYFATCDSLFDSKNGLMGKGKPPAGDIDQVGGSFHYSFLYQFFNRQMPFPEQRIDTILGLQRPDGYWSPTNTLWMTLDAIFLMTRTLRYCPHRIEDVRSSVRRALSRLQQSTYSPEGRKVVFTKGQAVHSLTSAMAIAAEAQQFLGASEVVTDWPLKLVLDRRPFI